MGITKSAIPPSSPSAENPLPEERLYFQPWVPDYHKGITQFFTSGGTYDIHFLINAENCDPQEYVATLKWSRTDWNKPDLKIYKA
jgi:hypothetical protein